MKSSSTGQVRQDAESRRESAKKPPITWYRMSISQQRFPERPCARQSSPMARLPWIASASATGSTPLLN
eukprot:5754397-Amphidinium_carterae.1